MKIAITGGAGFIGGHLTRAYLDAGHDVLVIDSLCRGCQQDVDARARFYQLDVRDEQLRTILQQERPDIVSHHVAQWRHDFPFERALADADVHIRGLLHVLDCCVDASVRKLIFASGGNDMYRRSGEMENSEDTCPLLTEETPLHPRQPIDISRMAGECYIRHYTHYYGLKHTILRYADVYGETRAACGSDTTHPIHYFITQLAEQRRPIIRGAGEEMRDHIYIDDVIRANLHALKQGENQTLHISSGQSYTRNQLYRMVAAAMQSELLPVHLSGSLATSSVALDNRQAKQMLDWQPEVCIQEGIQRTIASSCTTSKQTEPLRECVPVAAGIEE